MINLITSQYIVDISEDYHHCEPEAVGKPGGGSHGDALLCVARDGSSGLHSKEIKSGIKITLA